MWCWHVSLFQENLYAQLQLTFSLFSHLLDKSYSLCYKRQEIADKLPVLPVFILSATCVMEKLCFEPSELTNLIAIFQMLLCLVLFCSAVPDFRLSIFQPRSWKGESTLWGVADTSIAHKPHHCQSSHGPACDISHGHCYQDQSPAAVSLRDHRCLLVWWLSWTGILWPFGFYTVPLYDFRIIFSINNFVGITHSLVIVAGGAHLCWDRHSHREIGTEVWWPVLSRKESSLQQLYLWHAVSNQLPDHLCDNITMKLVEISPFWLLIRGWCSVFPIKCLVGNSSICRWPEIYKPFIIYCI